MDEETRHSTFCLCPSGTGWGMRAFHAIALGCIPVIIQDDGSGRFPSVLQAFEGLLLDWAAFSVRLLLARRALPPAALQQPACAACCCSSMGTLTVARQWLSRRCDSE